MALSRRPTCLTADEPLLGIGPRDLELIARELRALADRGAAVLVTGHEVEPLFELEDEVIWMVAGTTHGLGSTEDARTHT